MRVSASPADDARFMARALELAARGYYSTRPNPRVGCVLVRDGHVVGEGFHYRAGEAHAEVHALQSAGDSARGATAYVTLEPCCHHGRTPPCADALITAGVARVVYAARDPNPRVAGGGAARLVAAGIAVTGDVLLPQAEQLNRGFFRRMSSGRPFVTVKLGMSIDAKTALANGDSQWITGSAARADVQRLRAGSGAIVTGIGTVLADDPALTVRDPRFDVGPAQPLRVVLDSRLRAPATAAIFNDPETALVCTQDAAAPAARALSKRGVDIVACPHADGIDLDAVLRELGRREVNDCLVEAGPRLAGSFLAQGLFDEIVTYVAPRVLGAGSQDAFHVAAPERLAESLNLEYRDVRRVGADLRLTLAAPR